jgi:CMP-N-acetylneuraminic acid synthetase
MDKFTALVPMKAHSERVRNKNIRELGGVPLFHHILRTLESCEHISEICVDTDSDFIKESLRRDFSRVMVIDRPEHLRGGSVPMNSIIEYDLGQVEGDYFLQTHATNPFLKSGTIDSAIEFLASHKQYDSLFSVTKMLKRFYGAGAKPINHDLGVMENTQDLEPLYEENACIFLFTRASFMAGRNRIGKRPCMFEMDKREALDIDDEADFEIAERMFGR